MSNTHYIYCECCTMSRQKLATFKDGKLIIEDRRGGVTHAITLSIADLAKFDKIQEAVLASR
jgi:hypothetical protein